MGQVFVQFNRDWRVVELNIGIENGSVTASLLTSMGSSLRNLTTLSLNMYPGALSQKEAGWPVDWVSSLSRSHFIQKESASVELMIVASALSPFPLPRRTPSSNPSKPSPPSPSSTFLPPSPPKKPTPTTSPAQTLPSLVSLPPILSSISKPSTSEDGGWPGNDSDGESTSLDFVESDLPFRKDASWSGEVLRRTGQERSSRSSTSVKGRRL